MGSDCDDYLKLVDACASELKKGAICGAAMDDGEAMPCLILRNKPEDLSADCAAALPKQKEVTGLKKFWAEGKRVLEKSEEKALDEEDRQIAGAGYGHQTSEEGQSAPDGD